MIRRVIISLTDGTDREWKVKDKNNPSQTIKIRQPTTEEPWFVTVFQDGCIYAYSVRCIKEVCIIEAQV